MRTFGAILLVVAAIALPSINDAHAQGQTPKLYKWTDENGKIHYGDRIPPEYANRDRNVLGLMPHPEHAVDPLLGPTGGVPLLEGLIAAARDRASVDALTRA